MDTILRKITGFNVRFQSVLKWSGSPAILKIKCAQMLILSCAMLSTKYRLVTGYRVSFVSYSRLLCNILIGYKSVLSEVGDLQDFFLSKHCRWVYFCVVLWLMGLVNLKTFISIISKIYQLREHYCLRIFGRRRFNCSVQFKITMILVGVGSRGSWIIRNRPSGATSYVWQLKQFK